ncbi:MAG: hypothetical protein HKN33_11660 [Pyrinomonadaceae bacterium]|nr:hypothetical protein [Pyrinomonadaceae bacterium]
MIRPHVNRILQLAVLTLFGFVGAVLPQSVSFKDFKKTLTERAGFTTEDFDLIEKGKPVVRTIKSDVKHEVAVCGVIKLRAPNDISVDSFHRVIEIQEKKTSEEYGEFSKEPVMADLKGLTISDGELLDLRDCKTNSCKWNLPSDVIKRVTTEIDWEADDAVKQADKMIRAILLQYVIDYGQKGDSALFTYNDKPDPVVLIKEYESIQDQLFWVDILSPEFANYLKTFPENEPNGIYKTQNWSKIKIGLKPVIILTQNITYRMPEQKNPAAFIISKQIYANHYFDSTLAQTAIISYPKDESGQDTYLMFLNRSRAGAFKGTLGKLARGIVENQALSRLETVLVQTKRRSSLALVNREADADAEIEASYSGGWFTFRNLVWLLIIVVGLALIYWVISSRRKR